jgi:hypothetical protein
MLFDHGQERVVCGAIALLKDVFEIPSGLMGMNYQQEMEWGTRLGHQIHIP